MFQAVSESWKVRLRQYLRDRCGEDRERLSAYDFPSNQSVLIRFPDRSHVLFRYAFAITDEVSKEVAVFTEHCGYHVFPAYDAEVETLRSAWAKDEACPCSTADPARSPLYRPTEDARLNPDGIVGSGATGESSR